jgi:hypothetical protein
MDNYHRIGGTIAWIDDEWPGEIRLDKDGNPRYRFTPRNDDVLKLRDSMKKGCLVMFAAGATRCILPDGTVIRTRGETIDISSCLRARILPARIRRRAAWGQPDLRWWTPTTNATTCAASSSAIRASFPPP